MNEPAAETADRRTMDGILADPALELKPAGIDAIRADMENKALGSRYIDLSTEIRGTGNSGRKFGGHTP